MLFFIVSAHTKIHLKSLCRTNKKNILYFLFTILHYIFTIIPDRISESYTFAP